MIIALIQSLLIPNVIGYPIISHSFSVSYNYERGIPTTERLHELGLEKIELPFQKLRK